MGAYWGYPQSRTFAELLIDCEEDRTLRAVLVGMLREADGRRLRAGRSPGPITTEEHFRTFSMDRTGREAARTA